MKVATHEHQSDTFIFKKSVRDVNKYVKDIQEQSYEIGNILQIIRIQPCKAKKIDSKIYQFKVKNIMQLTNDTSVNFYVAELTGESMLIFKSLQKL